MRNSKSKRPTSFTSRSLVVTLLNVASQVGKFGQVAPPPVPHPVTVPVQTRLFTVVVPPREPPFVVCTFSAFTVPVCTWLLVKILAVTSVVTSMLLNVASQVEKSGHVGAGVGGGTGLPPPDGYSTQPLAMVNRGEAQVAVALPPLLNWLFTVKSSVVIDVKVGLHVEKSGQVSTHPLAASKRGEAQVAVAVLSATKEAPLLSVRRDPLLKSASLPALYVVFPPF